MQLFLSRPSNDLQILYDANQIENAENENERQVRGFGDNMTLTAKKIQTIKFDYEQMCFFNESGALKHEGMWQGNLPNGYGKIFHNNGHELYIGNIKKAKLEGYGIFQNEDGILLYQGNWKNSLPEGEGILYDSEYGDIVYKGNFKEGKKCGFGISYHETGKKKFEGQRNMQAREGDGILYDEKGKKIFEGKWKNNQREGYGKSYHFNGGQVLPFFYLYNNLRSTADFGRLMSEILEAQSIIIMANLNILATGIMELSRVGVRLTTKTVLNIFKAWIS